MFDILTFDELVENGKLIALSKVPFIAMMLSEMIVEPKEDIGGTMATDSTKHIWYDPKFEQMIDDLNYHNDTDKECYLALTLVHEIFHKIQKDNAFFKLVGEKGIHYLYNVAADSYINDIILEFFDVTELLYNSAVPKFRETSITTESLLEIIRKYDHDNIINIDLKTLKTLSNIERYNLLLQASQKDREMMQQVMDELMARYGAGDIQPGDDDEDGNPQNQNNSDGSEGIGVPKELSDMVKKDMIRTTQGMLNKIKSIGKNSSNFENIVGNLLEAKVDWNKKLRKLIREGAQRIENGEMEEELDKRLSFLHGATFKNYHSFKPEFIILLDTSGSMSGLHEQCVAEIASINKDSEIRLIEIDTEIKQDHMIKNGLIEKAVREAKFGINGYGGTQMAPGYEYLYNDKIKSSIIILMSDYELFGDDFDQIDRWSKLLKKKNNTCIHCHLRSDKEVDVYSDVMKIKRS